MKLKTTKHLILLSIVVLFPVAVFAQQGQRTASNSNASQWLNEDHAGFVENKGQLKDQFGKPNPAVRYLFQMPGLNVQLRTSGFSYDAWIDEGPSLPGKHESGNQEREPSAGTRKFHRVDIELEGASAQAVLVGTQRRPEILNVINGSGNFNEIHSYGTVTYQNIYPGIDLEFVAHKGTDKPVEYNFIVHPGADASRIRMKYTSGSDIALRANTLEIKLAFGVLTEKIPDSYTRQDGNAVAVRYKTEDTLKNIYAFHVPGYDKRKTLVIDPTPNLAWATYYGGSGRDEIHTMDVDALGNIYVGGTTWSANNIATGSPAHQTTINVPGDAFIVKFDRAGKRIWGTYYGGDKSDDVYCIKTNGTTVYAGGETRSATGIASPGSHQGVCDDCTTDISFSSDGLLFKLNASNGSREWGTYYGGSDWDQINGIGITPDGGVVIGGTTESPNTGNAIVTPGAPYSSGKGMIARFSPNGAREWGTYYPAGIDDLKTDGSGNIFLVGTVYGDVANLASAGTFQPVYGGGGSDLIIAKLAGNGTRLWATFFGGTGGELYGDVVLDHDGNVLIAGSTTSSGLSTPGSYNPDFAPETILGFALSVPILVKFDKTGNRLWATYYYHYKEIFNSYSLLSDIDVDEYNNVVIALTQSNVIYGPPQSQIVNAATDCSYQEKFNGVRDILITKLSADGASRTWSTFFGTSDEDWLYAIKCIGNGKFLIGGLSLGDGLATPDAFQPVKSGDFDAFLALFTDGTTPPDLKVSASAISPTSQTACILGIPDFIVGNAVGFTSVDPDYKGPLFYQWQVSENSDGPWTDISGETSKDFQPPATQTTYYYRRLVLVSDGYCNKKLMDSSEVATVTINSNVAPIANADGPISYVCGAGANTLTLNGSATIGAGGYTYQWFAGPISSFSTPVAGTANYTPTVTEPTTYTLKVTDAAGCVDYDQATVIPVIADAGVDLPFCQTVSGVGIGTPPIASASVRYAWSVVSGTPSSLSCTNCAEPVATPAAITTYRLTTTVTRKNGSSCSTTDDVDVTPIGPPNGVKNFAGPDHTICLGETVVLGGINATDYAYTWTPGQYLSNSHVYNPTFDAGTVAAECPKSYLITASKDGCSFVDTVTVHMINQSITWEDKVQESVAFSTQANGLTNCTNATYSWTVVSGPGSVVKTVDGGAGAYLRSVYSPAGSLTTFRRTTTLNGKSCSAVTMVDSCSDRTCLFEIGVEAVQGCPKIFPDRPYFKLTTGVDPSFYNFSWSPASMVDDPTASSVIVRSPNPAIITCTVTNKYDPTITCTDDIEVNDPQWSIPNFVFPDKAICANTPTAIGIAPAAGFTYSWSLPDGLDDPASSNPVATIAAPKIYDVTVIENGSGCILYDTVNVTTSSVVADAGRYRGLCNGGIVRLGTPPPAGTDYIYSWEPVNTSYVKNTGPSDAQPYVLFAAPELTYTLTVTDPVSGCQARDTVTLRSSITRGEYTGRDTTVCPGGVLQLGEPADPSVVSYQWTRSDGSAAPELSCSDCANPILTIPAVTTSYKIRVSYEGCTTPAEDEITVTVKPAPAFDLIDKTYCPTAATAIGFGSAGNPTAPANADSYEWSPATGLSCSDCANPTTTIKEVTTYTVAVTYANGCARSDAVHITPNAIVNAGPDVSICNGQATQIGSPAVPGMTYQWTSLNGGAFIGPTNIAQPTVNPATTSTYEVTVTSSGCAIKDTVMVTVNTPAEFVIDGVMEICEGDETAVKVIPDPDPDSRWEWTKTDEITCLDCPNRPEATIMPLGTGRFEYTLTQTDMRTGCSNMRTINITVNPNTINAFVDNLSICPGVTGILDLETFGGAYRYLWEPPGGLSANTDQKPTVNINIPGTYDYRVKIADDASGCGLIQKVKVTVKPASECLDPVTVAGGVLHDANGLADAKVNATSSGPIPSGLYVTLVKREGNMAVKTVPVAANGSYDFGLVAAGLYNIVLHRNPAGSTTPDLPSQWLNTGENQGGSFGCDASINGVLAEIPVTNMDLTDANFGIQQPPLSDTKNYRISTPEDDQVIFLNGTHVSTGGTSAPGQLTGSDAEDGTFSGNSLNRPVVITAVPSKGELLYNGVKVKAGQKINNYDPNLLAAKVSGTYYADFSFGYTFTDSARIESAPASYTIRWDKAPPAELLSFTGAKSGEAVLLKWETKRERNSDRFEIERSADSVSWQQVDKVPASGFSRDVRSYSFLDKNPLKGDSYYRLYMMSKDGSGKLSDTIKVTFISAAGKNVRLVPNPAHDKVMVVFRQAPKGTVRVKLINSIGQLMHNYRLENAGEIYRLRLPNVAKGVYVLVVEAEEVREHIKLVIH